MSGADGAGSDGATRQQRRAAATALSAASAASGALMDALQLSRAAGDAVSPEVLAALEGLPQRLEFDDDSYNLADADVVAGEDE